MLQLESTHKKVFFGVLNCLLWSNNGLSTWQNGADNLLIYLCYSIATYSKNILGKYLEIEAIAPWHLIVICMNTLDMVRRWKTTIVGGDVMKI